VVDLVADALNCQGDSDTLACYMLVPDVLALALPFVPGAANNVVKARRQVEDVGDAVRAARWVDDVGPYKVYVDPKGRGVPQYEQRTLFRATIDVIGPLRRSTTKVGAHRHVGKLGKGRNLG
jgi:hypothetical protein